MARYSLTAIELEIEDLSHLTLMNIATAIYVEADHRWKKVDYLGRSVCQQRINPLRLVFDATLNRTTI
jgi:hypothetical protein